MGLQGRGEDEAGDKATNGNPSQTGGKAGVPVSGSFSRGSVTKEPWKQSMVIRLKLKELSGDAPDVGNYTIIPRLIGNQ
jgi:hypothetical protein